jgi:hypothetical protein
MVSDLKREESEENSDYFGFTYMDFDELLLFVLINI